MTLRQSAVCGWFFACISLCVYAWVLYQMEVQNHHQGFEQTLRIGLYGMAFFFTVGAVLGYRQFLKMRIHCQQQTADWGETLYNKAMLVLNKRKKKLVFYTVASGGLLIGMFCFVHQLSHDWRWMVMYTVGVLWVHSLVICFVVWKRLYTTKAWLEMENKREET